MTKLEDIEKAIEQLSADDLARLQDWFEAYREAQFDQQIERDLAAGKLDALADAALAEHEAGQTRRF